MAGKPKFPVVDGKKPCSKCGTVLPFDAENFATQPDYKRGGRRVLAHCRACAAKGRDAWRATDRGRKMHRLNVQKQRATPEGRQASRESSKRYAEKNRATIAVKTAEWKKANPGHAKAWRDANRPRLRVYESRAQAKRAKAPGFFTADDFIAQYNAQAGLCFYCLRAMPEMHIEHKTPLSRGGTNWPENIVCACASCNLRKHNKTAAEFLPVIHAEQVANDRRAA